MQGGVTRGAQRRGGGKDIISKSQARQNHPAWPPVSGEGGEVNTLVRRFHSLDMCCGIAKFI